MLAKGFVTPHPTLLFFVNPTHPQKSCNLCNTTDTLMEGRMRKPSQASHKKPEKDNTLTEEGARVRSE